MSLLFKNVFQKTTIINNLLRQKIGLSALQSQKFSDTVEKNTKLSGFAQAFERHTAPQVETPVEDKATFASLLRNSKFVDVSST